MFVTILGKRWNLRFVPYLGTKVGDCDPPTARHKQIRIESSLKNRLQLDTIIHELLHAANWSLDEEHVTQAATDIAAVLWRLGYRKCE